VSDAVIKYQINSEIKSFTIIAWYNTFFTSTSSSFSNSNFKDSTGLKKLSKAFMACKSGNFKAGVVNTGNKIKKNTIGKVKKKDTHNGETTANKISKVTKEKTQGFKNKLSKIFSGTTKQYPKYIKNKKNKKQ
jgi:hypothetical protein